MLRTKMLFTIGPATDKPGILRSLMEAGMNCARFNFSHGEHREHAQRFKQLKQEAKRLNKPIAALVDLTGPKLRVGRFKEGAIELKNNGKATLTTRDVIGEPGLIPVSYSKLAREVKKGDMVLLDDGLIHLEVMAGSTTEISCKVLVGGTLQDRKGINLPGVNISIPALTPKDINDLEFGLKLGVDFIALSFVRKAEEIIKLKKIIKQQGYQIPVIAKIEKPEAIPALNEIIKAADGLMIARGDLGVEMSPEKVPILQKHIIGLANRHGRLVITATQMLQSMMANPTPTRAEASDVANAIFDGTDAVMLSGETAAGAYPKQAANMMKKIVNEAENSPEYNRITTAVDLNTPEDYVVATGVDLAEKVNANALVVYTRSGHTARLVSRQRPQVPIIVLAHDVRIQRRLSLWWGMDCLLVKNSPAIEAVVKEAETNLLKKRKIKPGNTIVVLAGSLGETKVNFIKLHVIAGKK